MKLKNLIQCNRGIALGVVVVIGTVIGIFALVTYTFVRTQVKTSFHISNRKEAMYTARAGIEYALFRLRNSNEEDASEEFLPAPEFTKRGDVFEKDLNVEDPFGTELNELARKNVTINIEPYAADPDDPINTKTADGLRNRYKVTTTVSLKWRTI